MLFCYPQLSTGALAQYPLAKTFVQRTVMNQLADGTTVRLADPDARIYRWELQYRALSDIEREALEKFFRDSEGPLRSFLFLDPCGNLLTSSTDFEQKPWNKAPLLSTVAKDGTVRVTNTSQATQTLQQTVS